MLRLLMGRLSRRIRNGLRRRLGFGVGMRELPADAFRKPSRDRDGRIENRLCVQEDFRADYYARVCAELREPPVYHRKQWEFVMIYEALRQRGKLRPGSRGLGFGVGQEPLPAAFAKAGCAILATDLPEDSRKVRHWTNGNQWCSGLAALNGRGICEPAEFERLVRFRPVDMNRLPDRLGTFDFTWSSCCFEHCGSIKKGLRFLRDQLKYLAPGGVAVHTTELNLQSLDGSADTIDHEETVLFRKRDIDGFIRDIIKRGYRCNPVDYALGDGEMDRYIDLPPFCGQVHLKLQLYERYASTSLLLIIERPSETST